MAIIFFSPYCSYRVGYCGNGVVEHNLGESCDPPGDCCDAACHLRPSGAVCRASEGQCDMAEVYVVSNAKFPLWCVCVCVCLLII